MLRRNVLRLRGLLREYSKEVREISVRDKRKEKDVWDDDPWKRALSQERTLTGFAEIEIDWNYVERLMPHEVIPPVPHHASYPTPSGWKPPNPRPGLSFHISRWRDHTLPLFLESRRDQLDPQTLEYDCVELVNVRNVQGDVFACEAAMREYLEKRLGHKIATHVDELKGIIKIKGAERSLVEECLFEFGF